eukprot:Seg207.11 transcript_id=Seg207.11/GoldUCD/mRNA.D3Y31 product="hypothetical protein" protein_id=Seg207.11/GoldUCD/D3Y31
MAQDIIPVRKQKIVPKLQTYSWLPNVKISELLDSTSNRASSRSYSAHSQTINTPSQDKLSDQSSSKDVFRRVSPIITPWSGYYKGFKNKSPRNRQKIAVSNLSEVEKKLSSLSLEHSNDEIYKRHFLKEEDEEGDETRKQFLREEMINSLAATEDSSPIKEKQSSTATVGRPKYKPRTLYKSPREVKYLSKSSKRHRFCLSKYPHKKKNMKKYHVQDADELQHEVTVDQKGLKEAWEYHVLGKLSDETQCFINHRFDGKEKPREKLVDFLDAGYRDKDRMDYMSKRKRRLFDMPYKHDDFPGASTHL